MLTFELSARCKDNRPPRATIGKYEKREDAKRARDGQLGREPWAFVLL